MRRNKRSFDLVKLEKINMDNDVKKKQLADLNSDISYYNELRNEIVIELESSIKNKKSFEYFLKKSDSETSFESISSFNDKEINEDVYSYFEFKKYNPKIIKSLSICSNMTDDSNMSDNSNISNHSNCFIDKNKDLICNIDNFSSLNEKLLFVQNNIIELEDFLDDSNNFEDQPFF